MNRSMLLTGLIIENKVDTPNQILQGQCEGFEPRKCENNVVTLTSFLKHSNSELTTYYANNQRELITNVTVLEGNSLKHILKLKYVKLMRLQTFINNYEQKPPIITMKVTQTNSFFIVSMLQHLQLQNLFHSVVKFMWLQNWNSGKKGTTSQMCPIKVASDVLNFEI